MFSYILNILIYGFECVLKMGNVEGYSIGGSVVDGACVCTLGGCKTGSNFGDGAGVLAIVWC